MRIVPTVHLEFPKVERLTVHSLDILDRFHAPAIRHLSIPLPPEVTLWSRLCEAKQIPVDGITSLRLELDTVHLSNLQAKDFLCLSGLTTLIITHLYAKLQPYRWPYCWISQSDHTFPSTESSLPFPKLIALEVEFPRGLMHCCSVVVPELRTNLGYMMLEIESFILARKQIGRPIHHLKLNYGPESIYYEEIDRLRRSVDVFEVTEHRHYWEDKSIDL